jgi:hypothetical protein
MLRLAAGLALLSAALIALAGCGGGTSKEDFAKEADEICKDVEEKIEKIGQGGTRSVEQAGKQLDEVKKESQDGVKRLSDLDKPSGDDGEKAEEFVDTLDKELNDQAIPALEELAAAVRKRDRKAAGEAVKKLQSLQNTRSDELARDIGARECVQ